MQEHFEIFAGYNQWANRRLYEAAARLSDADYRLDRRAFFGSIHRTLNHILVTDRIWLSRLTAADPTTAPARLDEVLYESLAELRRAREAEDQRIIELIGTYSPELLTVDLTYRNPRGKEFRQPLWQVLDHLFNHQTHHRGQVHAMISQAGAEAPSLDLIAYLRELREEDRPQPVTG